jgi:hypothetical protein
MSTLYVDHPYTATRREHTLHIGYDAFSRALESLLGTIQGPGPPGHRAQNPGGSDGSLRCL